MNLSGTEWVAVIGIVAIMIYGIVAKICETIQASYKEEDDDDQST